MGLDALPAGRPRTGGVPSGGEPPKAAAVVGQSAERTRRPEPRTERHTSDRPVAVGLAASPPVALRPLDRQTKLHVLEQMDADEVRGCTKCPLHASRTQTVFGEGDPDADILFIGEGPGSTEDELGRPFVGRAGALLDKMIVAMGLERKDVFIANAVKCRPPNNRTPTPLEVDTCWDYLRRQIETIQPKVIVTLGGPAAKIILNTKEGITRLRGTWHSFDGVAPSIPVMPTFHPAYLLRAYTPENRRRVWSDLQAVMQKVGSSP